MNTTVKAKPAARTERRKVNLLSLMGWGFLVIWAALVIGPLLWTLKSSLSVNDQLFQGPLSGLTAPVTMDNFLRILGLGSTTGTGGGSGATLPFAQFFLNSVIYTALTTLGQVVCCTMAAYAFARLRFPLRNFIFGIFLTALMIPPIFTMLPNFLLMKNLGLVSTMAGLVLPTLLMTPFAVFFMRQFFLSVPREIEEAAIIDGANHWTLFSRIVTPMVKGPILTLGIITAVQQWNDYLWPLLIGRSDSSTVLTVGLSRFLAQSPNGAIDWSGLMAGSVLTVLPVLALLLIFGKKLVSAIQFNGIK